jgi:hypothetical protein
MEGADTDMALDLLLGTGCAFAAFAYLVLVLLKPEWF